MKAPVIHVVWVWLTINTVVTVNAAKSIDPEWDKPPRLFVASYDIDSRDCREYGRDDCVFDDGSREWDEAIHTYSETLHWRDGADSDGTSREEYVYNTESGTTRFLCKRTMQWPATEWPRLSWDGTQVATDDCSAQTGPIMPPSIAMEYCDVTDRTNESWFFRVPTDSCYHAGYSWLKYKRRASTEMKLLPGGKSVPGRKSLFRILCTATAILDKRALPDFHSAASCAIPSTNVILGEFGRLDSWNCGYKALPDGAPPVNVTPYVAGTNFYWFDPRPPEKLRMELNSVTFEDCYSIRRDTNGTAYPAPHWTTNASYPILYTSGTHLRARVNFRSVCDPVVMQIDLRGMASSSHFFWVTNNVGPGDATINATAWVALTTNRVDFLNPLYVHWMYRVPGKTEYIMAGTSANQVYVSWHAPQTGSLFHTVADVACRNAKGLTTESEIVAGIWSDFTDRSVLKWDGSGPMLYWGDFMWTNRDSNIGFSVADLLKYSDARCGAWARFFRDTIKLHGITSAAWKQIVIAPLPGLSTHTIWVKNWDMSPIFATPPSLPIDLSGIAGQGTSNPLASAFPDHAVVTYGTTIYDPSYGHTHQSLLDWQSASLDAISYTYGNSILWVLPPFSNPSVEYGLVEP